MKINSIIPQIGYIKTKIEAVEKNQMKYLELKSTSIFIYLAVLGLLEKAMAIHSSTLAWKIPWTEEPGGLQSMGSLRAGHN